MMSDSPQGSNMSMISLPRRERPADLVRWMVRSGLMAGLGVVLYVVLAQFDAVKECRGGAFSPAFSHGFDVRRCDLVIRRFGYEIGRFSVT
jgi:hypothetical protein